MYPENDSKTTLSKWPFVVGDALLVATALAIAVLGDWQLTNWQVASCVIAVALGAGLFVLPYVVEFRVRVGEEAEDREVELRIFERQIRNLMDSVDELDRRLTTSANESREAELKQIESQQPDESRLRGIEEKLAALSAQPSTEESGPVVEADASAPAETVQPVPEKPQREKPPTLERSKRESRVRHRPDEPRLLERAIDNKPDSSSSAVTRIIGAKTKPSPPPDVDGSSNEATEQTENEGIEAGQDPVDSPKESTADSNLEEDPDSTPPAATLEESADTPEATEQGAQDAPEQTSEEMLFAEDSLPTPEPKKRVKKKDTVLTASIFIGIGNKPYVRGSGAGLSWEQGQEMEFQEIGKWRWVAPVEMGAPVELQIYRNDTDADQSGTYRLEPGEKLDVSPVF